MLQFAIRRSNKGEQSEKKRHTLIIEGGVRVCGMAVLGYFWCGVAVIFISKYGIAVFRAQAVCGKFKFHVAVVGEISLCRGDLLLFHDKRIQILKGLAG